MKAVLVNGSPNKNGNTAFALGLVEEELKKADIVTERIEIGTDAIHGCTGCGYCGREENRKCVFNDDVLNGTLETLFSADALIVGSPVYYAGINGALKCYLDRAFFVGMLNGALFRHKVGAGLVAVRRGGEVAAWDQINKYFTISEMFVPSSRYWNMIFGMEPGEAAGDVEGVHTMKVLARNTAWLMAARQNGGLPAFEPTTFMNFIR